MNWREAMATCKRLQDQPLPVKFKDGVYSYSPLADVEGQLYSKARTFLTYHKCANLFKTIGKRYGVKL